MKKRGAGPSTPAGYKASSAERRNCSDAREKSGLPPGAGDAEAPSFSRKLRKWKGTAFLLNGKLHAVHNGRGQPFNNGIFLSNSGPIRVEITEVNAPPKKGKGHLCKGGVKRAYPEYLCRICDPTLTDQNYEM